MIKVEDIKMALIKCSECKSKISSMASSCVACGMPVPEIQGKNKSVNAYMKFPHAFPWISSLALLLMMPSIYFLFSRNILSKIDEILFVLYCIFFLSVWIVYFSSKKRKGVEKEPWYKTRTLRRLLGEASMPWDPSRFADKSYEVESTRFEDSLRRKAGASMQLLAILIAVSALQLRTVYAIYAELNCCDDSFKSATLTFSALFGFVSFICFVISVDALDVVFNKFRTPYDRHKIMHYYYEITINPKYLGLVSIILGVIFLVAYNNPLFGCLAISITLYIGYYHWFPEIEEEKFEDKDYMLNYICYWVILRYLIIVPIIVKLTMLF